MIRPSGLALAEKCGAAARLAEQYPEGSEYTEHGTEIHRQMVLALTPTHNPVATGSLDTGVTRALDLLRSLSLAFVAAELPIRLEDPESGDLITEGTLDLAFSLPDEGIWVIDHKTGLPEYVPPPEDNPQLHAYALALAFARGSKWYRISVLHIRDGKAWMGEQQDVRGEEMWWYLDRVKKAASRGPEPVTGAHCDGCFQRKHCPAFLLPAYQGPTALEPFTRPAGLTADNAPRAIAAVEAMEEAVKVAKAQIRSWLTENGPIIDGDLEYGLVTVPGKRCGPGVKELERLGLGHLVKPGQPYERLQWRRRKERAA